MPNRAIVNKAYRWATFQGLLLAICFSLTACSRAPALTDSTRTRPGEKRYPLTGEVIAVDLANKTIRVRHDEVKGLMPAMAMDFDVSPGDLADAQVGRRIRAELVTDGADEFHLEKIWPDDPGETAVVQAAAAKLTQETVIRGKNAYREVGEETPDFTLYDQDGRVVGSDRFKGKQIMLNFIFTRCQVTKMCPAAVGRFQQVQRLAREAGVTNLELISISLDPTYDTPGVLKEYAMLRAIDTSNYSFLTGPESAIKSLLAQFGVLTQFEGNILNHTATTLLINPAGKIVHRVDGSTWDVEEFVRKLQ